MPTTKNGTVEIKEVPTQVLQQPQPNIIDPITVVLDPQYPDKYRMKLTLRAMRKIQEINGDNLFDGSIFNGTAVPTLDRLAIYIWASLLWEHPELTLEEVEEMPGMIVSNAAYLYDRFFANWGVAMPEPEASSETTNKDADPNSK